MLKPAQGHSCIPPSTRVMVQLQAKLAQTNGLGPPRVRGKHCRESLDRTVLPSASVPKACCAHGYRGEGQGPAMRWPRRSRAALSLGSWSYSPPSWDLKVPEAQLSSEPSRCCYRLSSSGFPETKATLGTWVWCVYLEGDPGKKEGGSQEGRENQWKVSYWAGYGCDNGLHLTGGALRNNGSQSHASEGCGAPVLCGWRTPQGTLTSPYFWSAVEHTWQISISSKKTWRLAGRATWTQQTDAVLPKWAKGSWAWISGYGQLMSYCAQDTSALLGLSSSIYKVSVRMIPNS